MTQKTSSEPGDARFSIRYDTTSTSSLPLSDAVEALRGVHDLVAAVEDDLELEPGTIAVRVEAPTEGSYDLHFLIPSMVLIGLLTVTPNPVLYLRRAFRLAPSGDDRHDASKSEHRIRTAMRRVLAPVDGEEVTGVTLDANDEEPPEHISASEAKSRVRYFPSAKPQHEFFVTRLTKNGSGQLDVGTRAAYDFFGPGLTRDTFQLMPLADDGAHSDLLTRTLTVKPSNFCFVAPGVQDFWSTHDMDTTGADQTPIFTFRARTGYYEMHVLLPGTDEFERVSNWLKARAELSSTLYSRDMLDREEFERLLPDSPLLIERVDDTQAS